jgi:hypothetical protein
MKTHLHISRGPEELRVSLPEGEAAWAPDRARRWLDEQFTANDCEPLRAMGKVLTADKVLVLAKTLGLGVLRNDEALRLDFARAATAALGRDAIHLDLDSDRIAL